MTKITLNNVASLVDYTTAATTINTNSATIQTAFDNTLSRDGTAPNTMSASLDMNSNRILNLPLPVSTSEPLRLADVASVAGQFITAATGTSGHTVPYLDGNNTFSGTNAFSTITTTTINTATVPTTVDTLVAKNTVDTLTNKTLTAPVMTTPTLGVATATTVNKVTITAPVTAATLTIPNGVTLTGPAASGTAMTLENTETVTGVKTFGSAGAVGRLKVAGTTSGTTVLDASATASGTLTLPAATDTLIGKATTDTLTNKTYDTAGTGNSFSINGVAATANTGTGSVVRATTPTLVTPVIGAATGTSLSVTGTLGYGVGAGGAVTQITNRGTGVTLNTISGAITLVSQVNSATSGATANTMVVTNSTVAATDVIIPSQKTGTDKYLVFVTAVSAGSFALTFYTTGGVTNEAPVFNFVVIKGVAT